MEQTSGLIVLRLFTLLVYLSHISAMPFPLTDTRRFINFESPKTNLMNMLSKHMHMHVHQKYMYPSIDPPFYIPPFTPKFTSMPPTPSPSPYSYAHSHPSMNLPPPTPTVVVVHQAPPPPPAHEFSVWCVAKPTVPDSLIQEAMDYACGSGADCNSIQPRGPCFYPNSLLSHASYAFNSYWQTTKVTGGTCDFGGTAMLVTHDPSFRNCNYVYL